MLWQLCASPCDVCATATSVVSSVVGGAVSNTRRPRDSSFDSLDTCHNVTGAKGASNSSSSSSSSTKDVCAPFGVTAAGGKTLVDRLAGNHSGKRYGERGHTHWQTAAQSETESAGRQLQHAGTVQQRESHDSRSRRGADGGASCHAWALLASRLALAAAAAALTAAASAQGLTAAVAA
jgi:hypothetical protein